MHFTFTEFSATYRVVRPFRIPPPHYCGSMLRGVFGRALREASCLGVGGSCASACMAPESCAYARLFESLPPPEDVKIFGDRKSAPRPLIPLVPELGRGAFELGETFVFGLRVLGRLGEEDERRLVEALRRVVEMELGGERGRVEVDDVRRLGPREQQPCLPRFEPRPRRATIHLETPLWIEAARKKRSRPLLLEPSFIELFFAISRRLTPVCQLYGEYDSSDNERFAALRSRCEEVKVEAELRPLKWEREARARDQRHNMRGMLGTIGLTGELAPFAPYLHLAQYAHIGKSASFGLGRVRVDFAE